MNTHGLAHGAAHAARDDGPAPAAAELAALRARLREVEVALGLVLAGYSIQAQILVIGVRACQDPARME